MATTKTATSKVQNTRTDQNSQKNPKRVNGVTMKNDMLVFVHCGLT